MKTFIDLLATDGRGGKFLTQWSKLLREARGSKLKVEDTVTVPSFADPNRVYIISEVEWFASAGYWRYRFSGLSDWRNESELSKTRTKPMPNIEEEEATTKAIRPSEAEIWADLVSSLDRNVSRREQLLWLLSKGRRRLYELAEAMGITPQQANKPVNNGPGKDFVCYCPARGMLNGACLSQNNDCLTPFLSGGLNVHIYIWMK